jgi:hypothetical protein
MPADNGVNYRLPRDGLSETLAALRVRAGVKAKGKRMQRHSRLSPLIGLLIAAALTITLVPAVAAAKPASETCELYPGLTTVSWRGEKELVSIRVEWWDATPDFPLFLGGWTVIDATGKPADSIGTPAGAVTATFTWSYSTGEQFTYTETCV